MNVPLLSVIFILAIIALSPSILSDSVFAQTTPYTITNNVIVGDVSRAHIQFGNVFGSAISLNEIFEGTARADTGITISSVTFTQPPSAPTFMALLDCDGKLYITTEATGYTDTHFPIVAIIDNPGTSSFSSGDTLNLRITVNTSQNPKVATPAFCPIPATPTNPMAVSSVTEGVGGFDELNGAFGISTIQIGSAIYAIVASNGDSGVQIINVSNPAVPTAISSVADGGTDSAGNTFDTLSRSIDVATVEINSSTYALATSSPDDGIQIINISNPAAPTVASSIIDSTTAVPSTFDELDGATSVTTVKIGSATYALVASNNDDGVQIINITDPTNPTATSSVTDGVGGFNELDGARGVTTIQIGSATYALVASNLDDGVQIINITNPATPTVTASITDGAGGFDRLDGATDIATVTIGQSIYALVTANVDNAVQIIDITNPATPTPVFAVFDGLSDGTNIFSELDEATSITTIKVGSSTYALVASAADNGVQIINITNPARPTVASSIADGGVDGDGNTFDTLDSARDVTTIQIGTEIYALVTSRDDDGVQIIRVASQADSDPAPKPAPNLGSASIESPLVASFVTDGVGGFTTLGTPGGITTVKIGSSTYALVASLQDNSGGVQIIDITRPTAPILASEITVENSGIGLLDGSNNITTIKIGSDTYALVASVFSHGVQIINISDPTTPTGVFAINDGSTFDTLRGAAGITTVQIGPSIYALVASNADSGVQIINITDPAAPTAVTSIVDGGTDSASNTFDELLGATSITTVRIGSSLYALVAAFDDAGVQIIDITNPAIPLAVSSVNGNSDGFGDLSESDSITTIKIGAATYALVTAGEADNVQIIDITDPANPTPASSIVDGSTFDTLDRPTDITTVTVDGSPYALVAGNEDEGIQIINISDPTMPTAVTSITQGNVDANGNTFNRLDGPIALTTVQIDTSLYVLVTSNQGRPGVQIIRIADDQPISEPEPASPANPIPVSSIAVNTDLSFQSAEAVTTVKIGSSTYALVASFGGDVSVISGVQIIDITNPATPTTVSSITDATTSNGSPFDALEGARSITTVTIGRSTYALVASIDDVNGIQIIDISNPANPTAVISLADNTTDGSGGTFDTLARPFAVTTVKIGSATYALAADGRGDGVQIIDISNPAVPTAVSSVIDATTSNASPFDTLDGAEDVTTVTIGSDVYALVTASGDTDEGVQIINITNPAAPTVASSITNGGTDGAGGTFDQLVNADGISTITIGSSTYALVAAGNGIQIINITDPTNPLAVTSISDRDRDNNNSMFRFDEANDITTITIDSSAYALVTSGFIDNLQIINITDPANPLLVSLLDDDDDALSLDGPRGITTVQIGSSIYAVIASDPGARTQIIRIADNQPVPEPVPEPIATPENPIPESSVSDGDDDGTGSIFDTLDEADDITTVQIGASVYALVTANADDGIQIIDITNPAVPTVVSSITNGATFDTLDGARGITTVKIGSATYALVASQTSDGIQIINISNPAAPTVVSSISDGSTFDTLDGAHDITTVQIGSSIYALVAAFDDNGVQIINITDPAAPTAVSSITDGASDGGTGTFDELLGAIDITTVQIGSSVYALVASQFDSGVQIIDITDPAAPTAVSSITDGDTFDELSGAYGITTVQIDSFTYALVVSNGDNGIQIIDITDPATPTAVSSISDGNTFDTLDGATDIAVVTIGLSTYALVTAFLDDGIQIINITNPAAPTVAYSISDGSAFGELDGANGITTVQIGTSVYALATASGDDGVQIIRIAEDQPEPELEPTINPIAVSALTDGSGGFNELGTPGDVTTVKIGTSTYAIVSAFADDQGGIQIINMTNPAVPTVASGITTASSGGAARLDGSTGIDTVKIGSDTYVLVAATTDDAVQILNISNPANPIPVFTIRDGNTFDTLNGVNAITTVKIGSATYALVASNIDHGVQIIDISNPAAPTAVTSIVDGGTDSASNTFDELLGATSITTVRIGSSLYALVGAFSDNGVQIIDITDPADPLAVSSVSSNSNGFGDLSEANDITTVQIGSDTYALVASRPSNHLQIINISDPANPTHASSIIHDGVDNAGGIFDILEGPSDVTTITIGDSTYAIVLGNIDDGVQFINISNPIMPIAVSSVANGTVDADGTTFTRLDGPIALTTVQIDSSIYTLVASNQGSAGVQIIRIADASPGSGSGSEQRSTSSGGSSSDWKKKPTFGKSWEVSSDQLVKNGFSFNGYSLDITDNWHTDFVKTSTIIGEINHVTMRVFAFDGLRYVQLSLGLPEIGATSDAEADIIVHLERNYDNPNDYDIVGIEHEQKEPLVNTDSTTASITPSLCNTSHTEPFCYTIDIEFAVDAPLSHDVIAISAIDTKRRTTTTHINDGVEFLGESLLPAETASIFIKKTNQGKGNHIILTQDDRRYDTWTDQDGYQWMQNSYGTWIQQTLPDMIISHDGSTQVMTRLHSEFDSMVQQEQERAILVFDSKSLQSVPDEPFSYEFHEIIPRHLDEGLLEKMELEEILALEKMLNIYIYDDTWSEIDDDDSNE